MVDCVRRRVYGIKYHAWDQNVQLISVFVPYQIYLRLRIQACDRTVAVAATVCVWVSELATVVATGDG